MKEKKPTAAEILAFYRATGKGMETLPQGLICNAKTTKSTIEFLKAFAKIQEGKYVVSTKGPTNKIKHYLLGYPSIESVK